MQKTFVPSFPTSLHQEIARLTGDFFQETTGVDTVLVVNSCARGQAVPESDLDFAVLIKPGTTQQEIIKIEGSWQTYQKNHAVFLKYEQSNRFASLHLDLIEGKYKPGNMEKGEPIDYFEVEIGNQICYSAPLGKVGPYFNELQNKWLPYYDEDFRQQRQVMIKKALETWTIFPCMLNEDLTFRLSTF